MFGRTGQAPDLGHEPPLDAAGANAEAVDRRDVSLRWLGASILVGIAGGALIGASVYIALNGNSTLVEQPQKARSISYYTQDREEKPEKTVRKGDRLLRLSTALPTVKGGLRLPMTIKIGNREIIKVRQFVRVSTALSPSAGLYATNIPPFNPAKLMSEGDDPLPAPEPMPETADADVSLTKADLARIVFRENSQTLSDSDALAQLEAERSLLLQRGQRNGLSISPQFLLSRPLPNLGQLPDLTGQGIAGDGLFSGIEVRVIPENVTNIVKDQSVEAKGEDREFTLKRGETLQTFLASKGMNTDEIASVVAALGKSVKVSSLEEGQRLKILTDSDIRPGTGDRVLRVTLLDDKATTAIAALSDRGGYVSVLPQGEAPKNTAQPVQTASRQKPKVLARKDDEDDDEDNNEKLGTARIYDSLYETAAKNNVPTGMTEELVRMFGTDVDFQRRVSPEDSIEVLYSMDDESVEKPELLFAAITVDGETRKLYRYQGDDGSIDYLDDQGRSLKRFLLRKPITEAVMRSGFGMRSHPILRYSKMHTGVDWANRSGTPILAAGNGTIILAGWKSGYGQRIEIQHANGYVTSYSHQSRFAYGSVVGAKVRQGQVIGYVGSTGLSTGPHLHYEVEINGHLVDPMRIPVPRGRELNGPSLAEFKHQRDQINAVLEKTGSTLAVASGSTN